MAATSLPGDGNHQPAVSLAPEAPKRRHKQADTLYHQPLSDDHCAPAQSSTQDQAAAGPHVRLLRGHLLSACDQTVSQPSRGTSPPRLSRANSPTPQDHGGDALLSWEGFSDPLGEIEEEGNMSPFVSSSKRRSSSPACGAFVEVLLQAEVRGWVGAEGWGVACVGRRKGARKELVIR